MFVFIQLLLLFSVVKTDTVAISTKETNRQSTIDQSLRSKTKEGSSINF